MLQVQVLSPAWFMSEIWGAMDEDLSTLRQAVIKDPANEVVFLQLVQKVNRLGHICSWCVRHQLNHPKCLCEFLRNVGTCEDVGCPGNCGMARAK